MRILILCTGNTCRSQMAAGFFRAMEPTWEIESAGTFPGEETNPLAIRVMAEVGVDISRRVPRSVDEYTGGSFDYVITVCSGAEKSCPVFDGEVKHRLHVPFDDPAGARGNLDDRLSVYRRVRDEIREFAGEFIKGKIR